MDQYNRDHEIRTPAVQGSYEPAQSDSVIEGLKAAPGLSRGRHVDQRQQYARNKLEHEAR